MCAIARTSQAARSAAAAARIDARRREQIARRVAGLETGALEQAAHEREAVGVHAARRQPDQCVARDDARTVDDAVALGDAEREAREVDVVGAVHVGQLGGLAAEQRAARLPAAVGDALDDVGDALGVEPPDRDVVEEQHGIGAAVSTSLTHIATRSMPESRSRPASRCSISFVPTPSVPATSTGSR